MPNAPALRPTTVELAHFFGYICAFCCVCQDELLLLSQRIGPSEILPPIFFPLHLSAYPFQTRLITDDKSGSISPRVSRTGSLSAPQHQAVPHMSDAVALFSTAPTVLAAPTAVTSYPIGTSVPSVVAAVGATYAVAGNTVSVSHNLSQQVCKPAVMSFNMQ